jgi:hypothetical protein
LDETTKGNDLCIAMYVTFFFLVCYRYITLGDLPLQAEVTQHVSQLFDGPDALACQAPSRQGVAQHYKIGETRIPSYFAKSIMM